MRIVSLLPGATESLFALGLGDSVVAVTHECDWPPAAAALPRVTRPTIELEGCDSAEVERRVAAAAAGGRPLYEVDFDTVRALEPDLVVAQDVCEVCAVGADQVAEGLAGVTVLRQHPHTLEDVIEGMAELARVCGARSDLPEGLRARLQAVRDGVAGRRVRGVFLEWVDPPYRAGHWTPDILAAAGLDDPLARPGIPSIPLSWEDVEHARPEVLVFAPCGFDRERALREVDRVRDRVAATGASHVAVIDGSAYFNRPGPRLLDSAELLAGELWGPGRGH